jgi:hypothetical protein
MAVLSGGNVQPEKRHGTDVLADRQLNLVFQGLATVVIPVLQDLIAELVAPNDGCADMPSEDRASVMRAAGIA